MKTITGRDFFKNLTTAGSTLLLGNKLWAQIAENCGLTPTQETAASGRYNHPSDTSGLELDSSPLVTNRSGL